MKRSKALKQAGKSFFKKNCAQKAASLSYYSLISLAGSFLILVSAAGLVINDVMFYEFLNEVRALFGENVTASISFFLSSAQRASHGVASFLGFFILLFASTNAFTDVQNSLRSIFNVERRVSLKRMVTKRFTSFVLLLLTGLLFLSILYITWGLKLVVSNGLIASTFLMGLINSLMVILLTTSLFFLLYNSIESEMSQATLWESAFFASILFIGGKYVIEWYLTSFTPLSVYGAAGFVIGSLIWLYYSSSIFYLGACYCHHLGKNQNL